MTPKRGSNPLAPPRRRATRELYREHRDDVTRRTDRMFAALLGAQWLVAIVLSLAVSPYAWEGSQRSVHLHVWAAVVLGGLLSAPPIAMVLLKPGNGITRHMIAVGQAGASPGCSSTSRAGASRRISTSSDRWPSSRSTATGGC